MPGLRPQTSGEQRGQSTTKGIRVLSPQPPTYSEGPVCQYLYTSATDPALVLVVSHLLSSSGSDELRRLTTDTIKKISKERKYGEDQKFRHPVII